jgi:hypothetical protein
VKTESLIVSLRKRFKIKFTALCAFFATLLLSAIAEVPSEAEREETRMHPARAGWAEVEITPPLGIGLGGRGGPDTVAKRILDPLFAQVTYIRDSQGRGLVIVSFDVVAMPHELSDRLRMQIAQDLKVDWDLILLNASHTHSGPYMIRSLMAGVDAPPEIEQKYFETLCEKIRQACRDAKSRLQPVEAQVFSGTSEAAINRRGKNARGARGIIPDPDVKTNIRERRRSGDTFFVRLPSGDCLRICRRCHFRGFSRRRQKCSSTGNRQRRACSVSPGLCRRCASARRGRYSQSPLPRLASRRFAGDR